MSEQNQPGQGQNSKSFTGRAGRHSSRWTVKMADRISTLVITVGGIGTIVSVLCVFLVLFGVVVPLFTTAEVGVPTQAEFPTDGREPLTFKVDEYRALAWTLYEDGSVEAVRVDSGEVVWTKDIVEGDLTILAASLPDTSKTLALALSDGSVQFGRIEFATGFVPDDQIPESVRSLKQGEIGSLDGGVVQLTPQEQFRTQRVMVEMAEPIDFVDKPLRRIHHVPTSRGFAVAAAAVDGELFLSTIRERENMLTGDVTFKASTSPLPQAQGRRNPDDVFVVGTGNNVYALWNDGTIVRYDTRSAAEISLAETINVFEGDSGRSVTAAALSIGNETLNIGDNTGAVTSWFCVRNPAANTPDGLWLLPIHDLGSGDSPVTTFATSHGSRMLTIGHESGLLRVCHVTTDQELVELELPASGRIDNAYMGPKDDGLFAIADGKLWSVDFDPAYPETTFASLFGRVWYEGYDQPKHEWQSSYSGVGPEMKLGLRPLIFGTIKATVYSMLFGAPLALLAAIYTSEVLSPRWRTSVKSLIEMMASLPSVVLGFLAGLVIAPYVQSIVPIVLASFFMIPFVVSLGAFVWQQIPHRMGLRVSPYRLWFITISIVIGVYFSTLVGPTIERLLFADDIALWLDGQKGSSVGAWMLLLLPASSLLMTLVVTMFVNPILTQVASTWSRQTFTIANLIKFILATALAMVIAFLCSSALNAAGFDLRGGIVGTYEQRNAMVVGFGMGFAIIPIIYTIAEDALSTVPRHLRSASLGAGATPWQTAVRIVVPTAMSGLFSALMIGLGRAVGETMIVLMAAGNTPIEEWNAFNGFRTLSANIATELPEAVRGSTHYRTLFFAALTLLVLTFFVNTAAEVIRLRFRKRAVQL